MFVFISYIAEVHEIFIQTYVLGTGRNNVHLKEFVTCIKSKK